MVVYKLAREQNGSRIVLFLSLLPKMPHLVELFAGSCQVSRIFREHGYSVDCWENDRKVVKKAQIEGLKTRDVHDFPTETYPHASVKVLWASPPCHFFSNLSWRHYFTKTGRGEYTPNAKGEKGLENVRQTLRVIRALQPTYWFVENSRNILRHLIDDLFEQEGFEVEGVVRRTITYCSYGGKTQKPTDIWTNLESWKPKPTCRQTGCHVSLMNVSYDKKGIKRYNLPTRQAYLMGIIPERLVEELVSEIEEEERRVVQCDGKQIRPGSSPIEERIEHCQKSSNHLSSEFG